ncbi:MAG: sulfatase-like hydrolase/transferase [Pseudomonadota bacterium]
MLTRNMVAVVMLAVLLSCTWGGTVQAAQPNIVIVLLDDMGFSDLGVMGAEVATPSIDSLARNGLTLTQFYVQPRCSPTRAALLTGQTPHASGVGFLAVPAAMQTAAGAYQGYLHTDTETLASRLLKLGYATYMSGKWHLGEAEPYWPRRFGFDRYFGLLSGASSYYELLPNGPATRRMALDDERFEPPADGFFMTDATSERASEFVRQHLEHRSQQPFFLYLSYTAPHWPLHADAGELQRNLPRYQQGPRAVVATRIEAMRKLGVDVGSASYQVDKGDDAAELMAAHAAMITAADAGVGKLMQTLADAEKLDNTLFFVFSDNGASAADVRSRGLHDPSKQVGERGSYRSYGAAWASVSNAPLRGAKGTTFEGGIRTPLVMHWPQRGGERAAYDHVSIASVADIFSTALAAAGAEPESGNPDSLNLLPLFDQAKLPANRMLFWEHGGWRAVRQGRYKAVFSPADPRWVLFDLVADPCECRELTAPEYAQRRQEMTSAWASWATAQGVDDAALQEVVKDYRRHLLPPQK